jgi:hypothetical protein
MNLTCDNCLEPFGFETNEIFREDDSFLAECPWCGDNNPIYDLEDWLGADEYMKLKYKFERDPFDAVSETEE